MDNYFLILKLFGAKTPHEFLWLPVILFMILLIYKSLYLWLVKLRRLYILTQMIEKIEQKGCSYSLCGAYTFVTTKTNFEEFLTDIYGSSHTWQKLVRNYCTVKDVSKSTYYWWDDFFEESQKQRADFLRKVIEDVKLCYKRGKTCLYGKN